MSRPRKALLLAVVFLWLCANRPGVAASKYAGPDIPATIQVIVAYNTGGATDTLARLTATYWQRALEVLTGREIDVEVINVPGLGGEIGWTSLAESRPDGSTIGVLNLPAVPLIEEAREAGFEPWLKTFTPLAVNVIDPNVITLGTESDFAHLRDAFAAAVASPGSVAVGADGPLSDDHLAMYAAAQSLGAEFAFHPYAGGAPAHRALRAGKVDIAIGNVFDYVGARSFAQDACVLRKNRYDLIPDVPTCEDALGIKTGNLGSIRGFVTRNGTPGHLIDLYRDAFGVAFADPQYREDARDRSIATVEPRIGEQFGDIMREQQELVDEMMKYFVMGGYVIQ